MAKYCGIVLLSAFYHKTLHIDANSSFGGPVVGTALQTHSVDERQSHLPHISIQEALDWATAKQHRKALPDDWPLKSLKDRDCVSFCSGRDSISR